MDNNPRTFDELDYHHELSAMLKNLAKFEDFPHIYFYGPAGSGKKTRIQCFLRELYGDGIDKSRNNCKHVLLNNKSNTTHILSNYHIEIDVKNFKDYDYNLFNNLIKKFSHHQKISFDDIKFKIILLKNADYLPYKSQCVLRRIMEKYIMNIRIIFCGRNISSLINALKSRCLYLCVSSPSVDDIFKILEKKKNNKKIDNIKYEDLHVIANTSDRNLKKAIGKFEILKFKDNDIVIDFNNNEWYSFLKDTFKMLLYRQDLYNIKQIRKRLYSLFVYSIPIYIILKKLAEFLILYIDTTILKEMIFLIAHFEYRIKKGNKEIIHLEALMINIMKIYNKYIIENIIDDEYNYLRI